MAWKRPSSFRSRMRERSVCCVGVLGEVEHVGVDAGLLGGVALGADVGERGGVLADEDEREAGRDAALVELVGALLGLLAYFGGDGFAVDDLGSGSALHSG